MTLAEGNAAAAARRQMFLPGAQGSNLPASYLAAVEAIPAYEPAAPPGPDPMPLVTDLSQCTFSPPDSILSGTRGSYRWNASTPPFSIPRAFGANVTFSANATSILFEVYFQSGVDEPQMILDINGSVGSGTYSGAFDMDAVDVTYETNDGIASIEDNGTTKTLRLETSVAGLDLSSAIPVYCSFIGAPFSYDMMGGGILIQESYD